MSVPRFLAASTVVIVAVLCGPAALVPGFNGADLIVIAAPIGLAVIVLRPRRRKPPVEGRAPHTTAPTSLPSAGLEDLAEVSPEAAAHEVRMAERARRLGAER